MIGWLTVLACYGGNRERRSYFDARGRELVKSVLDSPNARIGTWLDHRNDKVSIWSRENLGPMGSKSQRKCAFRSERW